MMYLLLLYKISVINNKSVCTKLLTFFSVQFIAVCRLKEPCCITFRLQFTPENTDLELSKANVPNPIVMIVGCIAPRSQRCRIVRVAGHPKVLTKRPSFYYNPKGKNPYVSLGYWTYSYPAKCYGL